MPRVTMPQLGESVAEGTIGRWLKQVGDRVTKYEPIVEVITDKVNAEVPSPFEGVLSEILVEEGATVPNGAEIAVIEEAGVEAAQVPVPASPQEATAAADQPASAGQSVTAEQTASAGQPAAETPAKGEASAARPAPAPATERGPAGSDEESMTGPRNGTGPAPAQPAAASPASAASRSGPAPAPAATSPAGEEYRGPVTPAVRRLARENDVDLGQVRGTGHGGRVTREDVMAFVEARARGERTPAAEVPPSGAGGVPAPQGVPPAAVPSAAPTPPQPSPFAGSTAATQPAPQAPFAAQPPSAGPAPALQLAEGDELKPMTQMRKGIAAQMTRAAAVPLAYLTLEVDMSGAVGLRERVKREYEAREGIGLSYVAIVTKAVVEALRRNPDLNGHWTDQGLIRRARVNVGIAVAVEDGLIVPVIHDADRLSISGLNHAVADLAARARSNRLRLDDLQGGTFTVDNTGWIGSIVSAPIVNTPEVAIMTMEAIQRRPVVVETGTGEAIAIRPMMYICSAFDHRATDGAQMGRFMHDVKVWLEAVDETTAIW